jgi:hypothetical protein
MGVGHPLRGEHYIQHRPVTSTGPQPAQRPRQKTRSAGERERETRRVNDHQGQGLSGEWRGRVHAGASACRVLSRAGALPRTRRRAPGGCPASRRPVVARRYASLRHRNSRSVRVTRPTVPTIVSPRNATVRGAPSSRLRLAHKPRSPLTVTFPGKTIGTYQVGRGRVAAGRQAGQ